MKKIFEKLLLKSLLAFYSISCPLKALDMVHIMLITGIFVIYIMSIRQKFCKTLKKKIKIRFKITKIQSRSQKNMSNSLKTKFLLIGLHLTVYEVCH